MHRIILVRIERRSARLLPETVRFGKLILLPSPRCGARIKFPLLYLYLYAHSQSAVNRYGENDASHAPALLTLVSLELYQTPNRIGVGECRTPIPRICCVRALTYHSPTGIALGRRERHKQNQLHRVVPQRQRKSRFIATTSVHNTLCHYWMQPLPRYHHAVH